MGLTELSSNAGRWLIREADAETARFGFRIARLTILRGVVDRPGLRRAIADHPAAVLIGRYPAELTWVADTLRAAGRDVLPVGGLTYWESPTVRVQRPAAPGVRVVSAQEAAGIGPGAVADLIDELVRDTFADYGTHYRFNPLFDPDAIVAGYAEWACGTLNDPVGAALVLLVDGFPVGFATVAPDGPDLDVLLAGVRTEYQGRGLYATLLDAVQASADERRVVISTQTHNVRVQRAWTRLGWCPLDNFETVHLVQRGLLPASQT